MWLASNDRKAPGPGLDPARGGYSSRVDAPGEGRGTKNETGIAGFQALEAGAVSSQTHRKS